MRDQIMKCIKEVATYSHSFPQFYEAFQHHLAHCFGYIAKSLAGKCFLNEKFIGLKLIW